MKMKKTICLIGAGNLGSRYLEGIGNCKNNYRIYVVDNYELSLKKCKNHWLSNVKNENRIKHDISFEGSIMNLPKKIDLVIISTTANVRSSIIEKLTKSTLIDFWIIEKVVAQSEQQLKEVRNNTKQSKSAWVNIPRRLMDWAISLKDIFQNHNNLKITVSGNDWGMASNCIHYFDLVEWWTNGRLEKINNKKLNKWFESKRKGFYDIHGEILAEFSNGTILILKSIICNDEVVMTIENEQGLKWEVNQISKFIKYPDNSIVKINVPYQSILTPDIIDEIMNYGNCGLPSLDENYSANKILLASFLSHWNQFHLSKTKVLPIT